MEQVKRRGLIVRVYSTRNINHLNRFGTVRHVSKRMNYVVLYVNDNDNLEEKMSHIKNLHFVRSVEKSFLPDITDDFTKVLPKKVVRKETEETEQVAD